MPIKIFVNYITAPVCILATQKCHIRTPHNIWQLYLNQKQLWTHSEHKEKLNSSLINHTVFSLSGNLFVIHQKDLSSFTAVFKSTLVSFDVKNLYTNIHLYTRNVCTYVKTKQPLVSHWYIDEIIISITTKQYYFSYRKTYYT